MARKELIRKESWNYILYKYGTRRLLTVIFWGSFIPDLSAFLGVQKITIDLQ